MPKVAVARAGRDDQVVIRNTGMPYDHLSRSGFDIGYAAQQDANIWLVPKKAANWPGDVGRGKPGGRDLIQQWLEKIIIALVDQGDTAARVAQRLCRGDAAKAGADDDDTRRALVRHHEDAFDFGKATPQRSGDKPVKRQRPRSVKGNEAQHHQVVSKVDLVLEGRVDDRYQPDQQDRRDPRARSQDEEDQTGELEQDGQAGGQLRGQQPLGGPGVKEHLRHVEMADLHDA